MIRKKMRAAGAAAAAIMLGTCLILPAAADDEEVLKPTGEGTLTIDLQNKSSDIIKEQFPNVQYDVYKVADLVWLEDDGINSEAFYYKPKTGFSLPEIESYDALLKEDFDWVKVSDTALKQALDDDAIEPAETITDIDVTSLDDPPRLEGLEEGLYMVVAHEKGAAVGDYKVTREDGTIETKADSEMYTYYFSPSLISVPTKAQLTDDEPPMSSQENGEWLYDAKVNLKWVNELRYGSLIIRKRVEPGNTEPLEKAATFVFHVEATWKEPGKDERTVYDNYVSLHFDAGSDATEQTVIYDKFPISSLVKVTEVYDGTNYDPISATEIADIRIVTDSQDLAAIEGNGQIAEFENKSNKRIIYGHGIRNNFKYVEKEGSKGWDMTAEPDGSLKPNPPAQDEGGTGE